MKDSLKGARKVSVRYYEAVADKLGFRSAKDMLNYFFREQKLTTPEVSEKIGRSKTSIRNARRLFGVEHTTPAGVKLMERCDEKYQRKAEALGYKSEREMFEDLYYRKKLLIYEISERVGITPSCITNRMIRLKLKARRESAPEIAADKRWNEYAKDLGFADDKEMLETLYKDQSMRSIGVLLGVDPNVVRARMRRYGIKPRPKGGRRSPRDMEQYRLARTHKDFKAWNMSFDDYDPVAGERI